MTTQVIVLNGGSSSGKSGIARCLQAVLPDPWLTFGVVVDVTSTANAARESAIPAITLDTEASVTSAFRARRFPDDHGERVAGAAAFA